jgi:mitochondrial pyruvate carrier 2
MSIRESERNNDSRKNLLTTCRLVDNSRKTVYFTSYIDEVSASEFTKETRAKWKMKLTSGRRLDARGQTAVTRVQTVARISRDTMQAAKSFWNHPAGPKTIFFWAPTMKWGITAANIKDFTGLIWCKYSLDIIPKNYNLMSVNVVMAATGLYQLYRRMNYDAAKAKLQKTP